jgi:hypothetical protein
MAGLPEGFFKLYFAENNPPSARETAKRWLRNLTCPLGPKERTTPGIELQNAL